MKMRELQYTSNGLDICCQGNDPEQHSKCPRYVWKPMWNSTIIDLVSSCKQRLKRENFAMRGIFILTFLVLISYRWKSI